MDTTTQYDLNYTNTLGASEVYAVTFEGQPVMRVTCSTSDPTRRIHIARPDGTSVQVTPLIFETHQDVDMNWDADGQLARIIVGLKVDEATVRASVMDNLTDLLALLTLAELEA